MKAIYHDLAQREGAHGHLHGRVQHANAHGHHHDHAHEHKRVHRHDHSLKIFSAIPSFDPKRY